MTPSGIEPTTFRFVAQHLNRCTTAALKIDRKIVKFTYKGAAKSLVRPGRKQANVSVRMLWISFGALPCREKRLDDSSRLDVVEISRVPDMVQSLFRSWSG